MSDPPRNNDASPGGGINLENASREDLISTIKTQKVQRMKIEKKMEELITAYRKASSERKEIKLQYDTLRSILDKNKVNTETMESINASLESNTLKVVEAERRLQDSQQLERLNEELKSALIELRNQTSEHSRKQNELHQQEIEKLKKELSSKSVTAAPSAHEKDMIMPIANVADVDAAAEAENRSKIIAIQKQLTSIAQENDKLREKLKIKDEEAEILKITLAEAQQQRIQLSDQLEQQSAHIKKEGETSSEMDSLRTENRKLREKLTETLSKVKEKLSAAAEENRRLKLQLSAQQETASSIPTEEEQVKVSQLQSELETLRKSNSEEFKKKQSLDLKLSSRISELESCLVDKEKHYFKLLEQKEQEFREIKSQLSLTNEKLSEEKEVLSQELENMKSNLQQEISKREGLFADLIAAQREMEELRSSSELAAQARIDQVRQENANLEEQLAKSVEQLGILRQEYAALSEQHELSRKDVESLRAELETARLHTETVMNNLKNENLSLSSRESAFHEELSRERASATALTEKLDALRHKSDELQNIVDQSRLAEAEILQLKETQDRKLQDVQSQLQDQELASQQRTKELEEELANAKKRLAELTDAVEQTQAAEKEQRAQLEEKDKESSERELQLQQHQKKIDKLYSEKNKLYQKLSELEESYTSKQNLQQKEIETMHSRNEELAHSIKNLTDESATKLEEERQNFAAQLESAKSKLHESANELSKSLEEAKVEIEKLRQSKEDLTSELESVRDGVSKLNVEKEELSSRLATLISELDAEKAKKTSLEAELLASQRERELLKLQEIGTEQQSEQLQKAVQEKHEVQNELAHVQQLLECEKQTSAEIRSVLDSLQIKVKEDASSYAVLAEKCGALTERENGYAQKIGELERSLHESQSAYTELKSDIEERSRKYDELSQQHAAIVQVQVPQLQSELESARLEAAALLSKVQELDGKAANQQSDAEHIQAQLVQSQSLVSSVEAQLTEERSKHEQISVKLQKLEESNSELERQYNDLLRTQSNSSKVHEDASEKLPLLLCELEQTKSTLEAQEKASRDAVEKLATQLSQLQSEISERNNVILDLQNANTALQQQLAHQVEKQEEEKQQSEGMVHSLRIELDSATQTKQQLQQAAETLKRDIEATQKMVTNLQSELKSKEEECDNLTEELDGAYKNADTFRLEIEKLRESLQGLDQLKQEKESWEQEKKDIMQRQSELQAALIRAGQKMHEESQLSSSKSLEQLDQVKKRCAELESALGAKEALLQEQEEKWKREKENLENEEFKLRELVAVKDSQVQEAKEERQSADNAKSLLDEELQKILKEKLHVEKALADSYLSKSNELKSAAQEIAKWKKAVEDQEIKYKKILTAKDQEINRTKEERKKERQIWNSENMRLEAAMEAKNTEIQKERERWEAERATLAEIIAAKEAENHQERLQLNEEKESWNKDKFFMEETVESKDELIQREREQREREKESWMAEVARLQESLSSILVELQKKRDDFEMEKSKRETHEEEYRREKETWERERMLLEQQVEVGGKYPMGGTDELLTREKISVLENELDSLKLKDKELMKELESKNNLQKSLEEIQHILSERDSVLNKVTEELQHVKEQYNSLEESRNNLEREKVHLKEKLESASTKLRDKEQRLSLVEEKYHEEQGKWHDAKAELEEKIAIAEEELLSISNELSSYKKHRSQTEGGEEAASENGEIAILQQENTKLKNQVQEARKKLQDLAARAKEKLQEEKIIASQYKKSLETLQKDSNDKEMVLQSKLENLEQELSHHKNEVKKLNEQNLTTIQELENARNVLDQNAMIIDSMKEQAMRLQDQLESKAEECARVEYLSKMAEDQEKLIENLKNQISLLSMSGTPENATEKVLNTNEVTQLDSTISQSIDAARAVADLAESRRKKIEQLEKQLQITETQRDELLKGLETATAQFAQKKKEYEGMLTSVREERDNRVAELEAQLQKKNALSIEGPVAETSGEPTDELKAANTKLNKMKILLLNANKRINEQKKTIQERQARISQLEASAPGLAALPSKDILDRLETAEEKANDLELKNRLLNKQLEEVKDEFQKYQTRAQAAFKSKQSAVVEKENEQELLEQIEKLKNEVGNLKAYSRELESFQTSCTSMSEEMNLLQKQRMDALEDVRRLQEEIKSQSDSWKERYNKLLSEKNSIVDQYSSKVIGIEETSTGKFAQLAEQLKIQRERNAEEISAKDAEIERLRTQIKELSEDVEKLKNQLQTSTTNLEHSSQPAEITLVPEVKKKRREETIPSVQSEPALVPARTFSETDTSQYLHVASVQKQQNKELVKLKNRCAELQSSLKDAEETMKLFHMQEKVLKEEIRELQRSQTRESANYLYLKNIIVEYMSSQDHENLFPVISTILQFTPEEKQKIQQSRGGGLWSYFSRT